MSETVSVTVDDEPVTREITLEQVRAYLRAKGWEKTRDKTDRDGIVWAEAWKREGGSVLIYLEHSAILLAPSIRDICRVEGRPPAAVLREIVGEVEERPTRAELLAAVEEAFVEVCAIEQGEMEELEEEQPDRPRTRVLRIRLTNIHKALCRVGAGHPRAKSSVEVRADEIEAEAAKQQRPLTFEDALRFAREAHEDVARAGGMRKSQQARRLDAAAWLIVAQRLLAREAAQ